EDVREVARALTGWTVSNYNRDTDYNAATFVNRPEFHDTGTKAILGHTGNYDGTDAIQIILGHTDAQGSVSGRFLGSKLWTYFAATFPPPHVVDDLQSIYSSGHSVHEVVRAILLEPEFYEAHTRKVWVRSPVEYAVASVRMLEGASDFSAAANALAG